MSTAAGDISSKSAISLLLSPSQYRRTTTGRDTSSSAAIAAAIFENRSR